MSYVTAKLEFDFTPATVKYLDKLGLVYAHKPEQHNENKESLTIFDKKGGEIVTVHHTTTSYFLQHMFSYGSCQFDAGKLSQSKQ